MNRLRHYREKAELTQVELGKLAGLDQAIISKVEKDRRDFRGQIWVHLAGILKCTTDDLLGVEK